VAALDSPSGWQRDTAHMVLLWRADRQAVAPLEKLARTAKRPLARLHALCVLDGLKALDPALVRRALADADPAVRQHAVRLCEGRFAGDRELGPALVGLVSDPDAGVRLQLACTLGEWADYRAGEAIARMLVREAEDVYLTAALFSSLNKKNLDPVLRTVLGEGKASPALLQRLLT